MNPLEQLKDIHLPNEITWWPLAYGWWIVIAVSLLSMVIAAILIKRYVKKRRVKKLAIHELKQLTPDSVNWHQDMNQIIKRVCLYYFPDSNINQLHGESWLAFLQIQLNEKHQHGFAENLMPFMQSLYQATHNLDFNHCQQQWLLWMQHALPTNRSTSGVNQHV